MCCWLLVFELGIGEFGGPAIVFELGRSIVSIPVDWLCVGVGCFLCLFLLCCQQNIHSRLLINSLYIRYYMTTG